MCSSLYVILKIYVPYDWVRSDTLGKIGQRNAYLFQAITSDPLDIFTIFKLQ